MNYYGRKEEISILEKKYSSGRFEFGYLYGQRRIDKTSVIEMFNVNKQEATTSLSGGS